jgi:hypothetical protein
MPSVTKVNPSPPPITAIVLQEAPAQPWQVWAAFAPLIAAAIAGVIATAALWQRRRSDNRAEWWRRAQWAMDAALSDRPAQALMGQRAIYVLSRSRLASTEEFVFLRSATEDPIDAIQDDIDDAPGGRDNERQENEA